jgi:hypothetical protein
MGSIVHFSPRGDKCKPAVQSGDDVEVITAATERLKYALQCLANAFNMADRLVEREDGDETNDMLEIFRSGEQPLASALDNLKEQLALCGIETDLDFDWAAFSPRLTARTSP